MRWQMARGEPRWASYRQRTVGGRTSQVSAGRRDRAHTRGDEGPDRGQQMAGVYATAECADGTPFKHAGGECYWAHGSGTWMGPSRHFEGRVEFPKVKYLWIPTITSISARRSLVKERQRALGSPSTIYDGVIPGP